MCSRVSKLIIPSVLLGVFALAGRAMASDIAQIEALLPLTSGTNAACVADDFSGQFPVVTAVLSHPGVTDGHTYTSWYFLANDGTGSALIYASSAAVGSYTPTVGDALTISGKYSPYHQLPEIGTITAIGNPSTTTLSNNGDTLAWNSAPKRPPATPCLLPQSLRFRPCWAAAATCSPAARPAPCP